MKFGMRLQRQDVGILAKPGDPAAGGTRHQPAPGRKIGHLILMKHVKGRHVGTPVEAGRHLHEFMRLDADVISALAFHKPAAKRPCNGLMAEAGTDHRHLRPVTFTDEIHQPGKPWQAVI